MFDLSFLKIAVLGVLALVIFGPEQLPRLAGNAGRMLRELRRMADGAKADLQQGLGPEFQDFDFNDLNPRTFVRKHLFDELDGTGAAETTRPRDPAAAAPAVTLLPGENPPYDTEAT